MDKTTGPDDQLVAQIHAAWTDILGEITALKEAAEAAARQQPAGTNLREIQEIATLSGAYQTILQTGLDRLNFDVSVQEFGASISRVYLHAVRNLIVWMQGFESKQFEFEVAVTAGLLLQLKARECGRCMFLIEHLFENGRYSRMEKLLLVVAEGLHGVMKAVAAERRREAQVVADMEPTSDRNLPFSLSHSIGDDPFRHMPVEINEAFSTPSPIASMILLDQRINNSGWIGAPEVNLVLLSAVSEAVDIVALRTHYRHPHFRGGAREPIISNPGLELSRDPSDFPWSRLEDLPQPFSLGHRIFAYDDPRFERMAHFDPLSIPAARKHGSNKTPRGGARQSAPQHPPRTGPAPKLPPPRRNKGGNAPNAVNRGRKPPPSHRHRHR